MPSQRRGSCVRQQLGRRIDGRDGLAPLEDLVGQAAVVGDTLTGTVVHTSAYRCERRSR